MNQSGRLIILTRRETLFACGPFHHFDGHESRLLMFSEENAPFAHFKENSTRNASSRCSFNSMTNNKTIGKKIY